jgi:hypothetical protein
LLEARCVAVADAGEGSERVHEHQEGGFDLGE